MNLNTATTTQLATCADLRNLIDQIRTPYTDRRTIERVAGTHALWCTPCKQTRATHRTGCSCTSPEPCEHDQWRAQLQREPPPEPEPRPVVDIHLPEPHQQAA